MLKIRSEHMSALEPQQESGFIGRMLEHLREEFATEVAGLDDGALRTAVGRICEQCEEWGIFEETQVERVIELFVCFEQLRRRERPAWIQEIVTYPGRPGQQIVAMLEDGLFFGEKHFGENQ